MIKRRQWPSRTQQYLRRHVSVAQSNLTNVNSGSSNPGRYTASKYTRRADHTPQTAQPESETYVLALNTDEAHHKAITALRNQYFPARLNKLSAHVALFRALPGSELPTIQNAIGGLIDQYHPFHISTGKAFLLARGVALEAHVKPAQDIFRTLKAQWSQFLSEQDQSFRAHYTIQDKARSKRIAEKTLEEVQGNFAGSTGMVTGLSLYLYVARYWKLRYIYHFPEEREQRDLPAMEKTGDETWPALPNSKAGT
ncbi:MAG: hypothetical protein Q9188_003416 [Gyalolechia gomerana]